jgi:geranylgeranyl pyrophosphate synthase
LHKAYGEAVALLAVRIINSAFELLANTGSIEVVSEVARAAVLMAWSVDNIWIIQAES